MARLSETIIPGIFTGILHPKMKNRFSVGFFSMDDEELELSQVLAAQVINIGSFDLSDNRFGFVLNNLNVKFEDDVTNGVGKALKELYRQNVEDRCNFNLKLNVLNGNHEVLETYVFKKCSISNIKTSGFSYGSGNKGQTSYIGLSNNSPEINRSIDALSDEVQAIYHSLRNIKIESSFGNKDNTSTVIKKVSISYEEIEQIFY
jgi:hypothetical protein